MAIVTFNFQLSLHTIPECRLYSGINILNYVKTFLLYVHASFSGTNMLDEWYAFLIWHDYLFPLSICLFKSINMLHELFDFTIWYENISLYVHASFSGTNMLHEWYAFPIWYDYLFPLSICLFSKYKHGTWMIWLYFIKWTLFSSMCMPLFLELTCIMIFLFSICFCLYALIILAWYGPLSPLCSWFFDETLLPLLYSVSNIYLKKKV